MREHGDHRRQEAARRYGGGASEVTREVKAEVDPAQITEQKIRQQLGEIGYPVA